jgi:hypothetical protein
MPLEQGLSRTFAWFAEELGDATERELAVMPVAAE